MTGFYCATRIHSADCSVARCLSVTWGMKNHDFLPICHFISEMMQDTAIVTTEGE